MGQCCCKSAKYGAFQQDLGASLLTDISNKLPPDAKVVVILLQGLKDITMINNYTAASDPFVEVRVTPNDTIAGAQKQKSDVRPRTLNPTWVN
jgi:hypothetical protein